MQAKRLPAAAAALLGALLAIVVYLPGIHGPWLVDDTYNLGSFTDYSTGAAPYRDIIFGNRSGPLGRPVAMASFAANHAAGLFSTPDLKLTNIVIHACNGLLLYLLMAALLTQRPAGNRTPPHLLAALIATWWLILPMHISAVLYIVQRMTLLAATFSLACMLGYAQGRRALLAGRRRTGWTLLGLSLAVLLPLGILSKESAFSVPAWLVLIELFIFRPSGHLPRILTGLVTATILLGVVLVVVLPIRDGYVWRDFSLGERLLTESRVIWSYIRDIFLPDSSQMGLLHDDYPVSRGLLQPWTTLAALLALAALVSTAIRASTSRFWALSLGVLFYLAGHLIESTIISLELYFEHRNYLPSAGLILAASVVVAEILPLRRSLFVGILAAYLGLLGFSTLQRTQIWGDRALLMTTSALNHPHSLRAWTDYAEDLVSEGRGGEALQAALQGARNNPEAAGIFLLQMTSIYCRSNQAPPPALISQLGEGIARFPDDRPDLLIPLSIGLDYVFTSMKSGHCKSADFSSLAPGLLARDAAIRIRFGAARTALWLLRLNMAEWLQALGHRTEAIAMLRDIWNQPGQKDMPTVGLVLAQALDRPEERPELKAVMTQLEAVTPDAPPDFRAEMAALQTRLRETP